MLFDQNNYFNAGQAASLLKFSMVSGWQRESRNQARAAMRLNAKNRAAFLIECRRQGILMQDILRLLGVI